jgi:hypothetical protein
VHPKTDDPIEATIGFLEPSERVAEVLFGLIMVLTFTGSLSAAEADRAEVRMMLIGALGCNFAWGIIDAILYLMGCLSERARGIHTLHVVRGAASPEEAHGAIAAALPPIAAAVLSPAEFESMRQKLVRLPEPPPHPRLTREEWLGALGVFFWVVATTFPVAVPFMFMEDVGCAMRTSNAVAVALLFVAGYGYGRYTEYRPWLTGVAMVGLGAALVVMTIALGG